MIKVICTRISPYGQRIIATLEDKGLPYEVNYINLKNKPFGFNDVSPSGQVPILITENGKALFESQAIIEYLEEVYPSNIQLSPEVRAVNRAMSYLASKAYISQGVVMSSTNAEALTNNEVMFSHDLSKIETKINNWPFINGDETTAVDLALLPILDRARILMDETGYNLLEGFPKLQELQRNLNEKGLLVRSTCDEFVEVFTERYLHEGTFFGRFKGKGVDMEITREDNHLTIDELKGAL